MCGIVAILSQSSAVQPEKLVRALQALSHRGPDGYGCWISDNASLGLGHRRLSIIDHATGGQPIANEDGQIRIVVNGEFYDFEAIRQRLITQGHRFQTQSDSEIAVHLYEEHGLRFLDHLRGEFAFVLWDATRQRLLAARDRFGIKPLFYSDHQHTLYLASEAKALMIAGVPAAWNLDGIYRQLFMCYHADHALFQGIRQVPPGHILLVERGACRLSRYWDFSYPRHTHLKQRRVQEDLVQSIRPMLLEAVRLRLRADVPVGVLLSGGLDSSAVLGLASSLSPKAPAAFSIAFPHAAYDESAEARRVAEFCQTDFYSVLVTERDIVEHFADSVWRGEMVQYNGHGTARYLLSRLIRDAGYKVVLGGEGSDEVFVGYDFLQPSPDRPAGRPILPGWLLPLFRLARPATPAQRIVAGTSPWLARLVRGFDIPRARVKSLAEHISRLRSLLAPEFLEQFRGLDPYRDLFHSIQGPAQLPGREYARQVTYVWLKTFFANYHLAADRLDMAHSVEVRLPYLDHVLFEYVNRLPVASLTAPNREKALLREIARPYIPESVYNRTKQPFMAPPAEPRAGGPLFAFFQDVLRSDVARSVPFLHPPGLQRLLDQAPSAAPQDRIILDHLFMMLTSFCILHQRFKL